MVPVFEQPARLATPLPARGERSDHITDGIRVRGHLRESELVETPPHPDPLPASGEREKRRERENQSGLTISNMASGLISK
jgi:hypothetical protein